MYYCRHPRPITPLQVPASHLAFLMPRSRIFMVALSSCSSHRTCVRPRNRSQLSLLKPSISQAPAHAPFTTLRFSKWHTRAHMRSHPRVHLCGHPPIRARRRMCTRPTAALGRTLVRARASLGLSSIRARRRSDSALLANAAVTVRILLPPGPRTLIRRHVLPMVASLLCPLLAALLSSTRNPLPPFVASNPPGVASDRNMVCPEFSSFEILSLLLQCNMLFESKCMVFMSAFVCVASTNRVYVGEVSVERPDRLWRPICAHQVWHALRAEVAFGDHI